MYLYEQCKKLIAMNMPMSLVKENNIFERIISIKYDVANDELSKFKDYKDAIDDFYNHLLETNA